MADRLYDGTFSTMIFNYERSNKSLANCGALKNGLVLVQANESIEIPENGSKTISTGLKLKHGVLGNRRINPDELTYHFLNYTSPEGYSVEIYEEDPVKDLIGNRLKIGREIKLKIDNPTDETIFIAENAIL